MSKTISKDYQQIERHIDKIYDECYNIERTTDEVKAFIRECLRESYRMGQAKAKRYYFEQA